MKPNYEIRVGLFTLIALILLLWGWGWLKSATLFKRVQVITVRFHDVAGLNKNATVNINGVRVGIVDSIELKAKGNVLVHLRITAPDVVVTEGSTITIQTLGLVGAKYVEISLPEEKPNEPPHPEIPENEIVEGQDPVRVELVLNDMATRISRVIKSVSSDKAGTSLAKALEHSGEAVQNITEASKKLNKNMDRLAKAADSITSTSDKFGKLADNAQSATTSARSFFSQGTQTMESINGLTYDLKGTTKRVNKLLDNPALSKDLKETAQLAKETADSISVTMHELSSTLQDQPLRKDVIDLLSKLNQSTENIYQSVKTINSLARDGELKAEVKQMLQDAKDAMSKVGALLNQPEFKTDVKETIKKVKTAATDVDVAARQLHQVLNQRAPLLKMLFGRPGRLKDNEASKTDNKENK